MSKVLEMLAGLQDKLLKEGEQAQKVYDQFSAWCQDRSKNVDFEISTGKAESEGLSAAIEKESSKTAAFNTQIEELSGSIASDEANLKAATEMRASEKADFSAEEQESLEVIGTMQRAVAVLSRDHSSNGASMMQIKGVQDITQAMDAMVNASVLSSADADRLTSLVQNSQESEDPGAPDAAAYKSHSKSVIDTLQDLLDKAQLQVQQSREAEATNSHHYEVLKQSLTDEIEAGQKDMAQTKTNLGISQEAKATSVGDLATTDADLKDDIKTLASLHQDCTSGSDDFQAEK